MILDFGDSITAGYGLPPGEAFPARLEAWLRQRGIAARVVNAGVSGDTTAGGLARLDWALADKPDLVILALGANDALRGIDPAAVRDNLDKIMQKIEAAGAKILLLGMLAPPNWGEEYQNAFDRIFPDLARAHHAPLYSFFLEGVAMKPELNQPDGLHPNERGVAVLVDRIAPIVARLVEGRVVMSARFASAAAAGDPATLAARCIAGLAPVEGANLGILYATEPAAAALPQLVDALAAHTGVRSWVGGVGLGVCSAAAEVFDEPAAVVMTAALPPDDFRIFAATGDPGSDLPRRHAAWIEASQPALALVHADPRCPDLTKAAVDTAGASGAFLVGGLVSHRCESPLVARTPGEDGLGGNGVSGLMLAPGVAVATALTQGCSPIGPVRRIDEARDNVVMTIDGRPALSVFIEDIGPVLATDMRRVGGLIFAGLPVAGSDTGDYLVRNLLAIDPGRGWIVLGAEVAAGDSILFCRRDPDSARADMARMVRQLAGRLDGPPKAGVYVSCVARGAALFGEPGVETGLIRESLGDFPLIGFFANGEISRDRLYGHTGVLTLFT